MNIFNNQKRSLSKRHAASTRRTLIHRRVNVSKKCAPETYILFWSKLSRVYLGRSLKIWIRISRFSSDDILCSERQFEQTIRISTKAQRCNVLRTLLWFLGGDLTEITSSEQQKGSEDAELAALTGSSHLRAEIIAKQRFRL